jgi:acetolactate synthase-1/2/3 large subunit
VSLRAMIEAAAPRTNGTGWPQRVRQLIAEWRDEHSRYGNSDATPIGPSAFCRDISDVLPPDGVVVSDTGHAGIWTAGMIDLKYRGRAISALPVRSAGAFRRRSG